MERNGLEGKRVSVYFNDGERVVRKDGICTENSPDSIILDNKTMIPKLRIIRAEVISQ